MASTWEYNALEQTFREPLEAKVVERRRSIRGMSKVALLAALFASGLAVVACKKSTVAPPDAGADAGAPRPYAGPFEAHVVARSLAWRTRLVARPNGIPVLDAGIFRYELTADGRAERIGDFASYVKQMPPDDDSLGGYDVQTPPGRFAFPTTSEVEYEWPDVRAASEPWQEAHARDEIDAPAGIEGGEYRRAVDGTGILLARAPDGNAPVSVVAPRESKDGTLLRFPDLDPARGTDCKHMPSWQKAHVLCSSRSNDVDVTTVYRLVGDARAGKWERVRISDELTHERFMGVVGHDGTLWLGVRDGIVRVATNGAVDTIMLPMADAKLARPYYFGSESFALPGVAQINENEAPQEARRFERVPRRDGEAWVIAVDGSARVLVHLSRPAIAPLPDALPIGTETDQRNEIRNSRPPVVWVGHCAQLFIALAKQRADGSFASESVWSRETTIAAAMKKSLGKVSARTSVPNGALVEGLLGGRRVAGVLVWRGNPSVSEELLEKSVRALAEELTSVTGLPPDITCTAPVLERASKL